LNAANVTTSFQLLFAVFWLQLRTIGTTGIVWRFESVSYALKVIKALIKSGKYARALCGPEFWARVIL